ncbi:Right handed beta helix region/Periplasmic copper-binding protein (NosD), putative [Angomonas deanei]|uniref:Right handed beta helix region/Periplasmic copper-binding protein (NosD), putative n=1 Tax=Angomonas deanei TaxID=59799 RepID=A0A7G2CKS1_9TRYP|nr:Right handed beta helix region/Periplasmic copper-binding protein (NosD), putative [Angomonas deanei]
MAFGMLIVEGLEGTYEYNTVIQCGKAGVRVSGKSLLDTSSTYTKAAGGAKKADGRREKNSPSRTCVVLRENTIADSLQAGIVVEREGNVLMRGNIITNCTQAVAVRGGSTVCFVQNVVERCLHGFLSDEEATVQLLANRFEHIEGVTVCSLGCQSLRVLWNVITHSGTAFFLRRVVNGSISDNILDSIYKYGFFLGMECHVTVTRNRLLRNGVGICFGEPQCKAEVLDNIIRDSTCHGIRIAGDHMDRARCMYNLVLGGETGACVYPADLTLSYNVFLNCKKGVVIAAPNITPAQPALKPSTSLSKAQRKLKNMMPSASVAKAAEGITSLSSTVNGATSATAPNTNQKGARFVGCLFSCCSHGGVATAFSNTVLERCLLLHNDVGFHFLGPHASAQLERSIIANSAAIGLYGEQKSAGVVRQCCLFKNYINVACESDTVLRCERTVLQAPVVFNSYSSGPLTKPVFEHCLLSSSALMSAKQQKDSTKKKETAEEKQGAERNSVLMVLRTIVRIENADDDDKAARHLMFALPKHKKGGGEEEAKRAVLTISENDAARWSFVPSLWLDLYEETPAWRYASDSQHASYFAGKPFPCADRRSAILWPRNHNERAVLGGPGGPFRLHRVCTDRPVAAQDDRADEMESSTRPSSYVYACSGVWLEDSAAPTFEGSFIGSHISVGTSATILLGPNTADGEEWLVNPVAARQEREQHADPEGATAEAPPENKKKNKKKEIKRKKSDATREETPHDTAEEVTPAPTASFSPTYDPPLLHVRPSDENISPLSKVASGG